MRSDAENPNSQAVFSRAEFACAGSRFEDKIFVFGGVTSKFTMTNEVLVLHFNQLQINPLLADQY